MEKIKKFFKDEEGATAMEYGILVALIAVAIIAGVTLFGSTLSSLFTSLAGDVPGS
jgi:pilus assembly protein Flp/PilA